METCSLYIQKKSWPKKINIRDENFQGGLSLRNIEGGKELPFRYTGIFYKLLLKLFQGNHLKDYVRPIFNFVEDLMDGDILLKNSVLKKIYKNKRCFILGTGYSLNDIDLNILSTEFTFGCNHIHLHPDMKNINLNFYANLERVSTLYAASLNDTILVDVNPKTLYPTVVSSLEWEETIFFFHTSFSQFIKKNNMFRNRKVHFVKSYLPIIKAKVQSNDLTKRITFMDGALFFMIASSIYMGFKDLYLCGCGYTYEPISCLHFYDKIPTIPNNISKHERRKLLDNIAKSYNAIVYNYDEPTFIYTTPLDVACHTIMKNFAHSKGVRIFNIVPDSFESPVYEKVSLEDVYQLLTG